MIPWEMMETKKNSKIDHTNGRSTPSSPNALDESIDSRARASNLQGGEEKERGGARGERVAVGGKDVNM